MKLLAIPVDRDALHALMKVCLRLTRDYKNAEVFAREGGVKLLLEMTQMSSFTGCINLSTLLIRHTLEEPRTLRLAMEKVITRTERFPVYLARDTIDDDIIHLRILISGYSHAHAEQHTARVQRDTLYDTAD